MFSLWNVYAHMYPVSLVRLIKLLNKRLWLMQKALSCSSGVVPVFCGLGSPGKWTDGVRECELVTTATLKDCCQRDAVFSWYLFSLPQSAVWNLSFDLNRRDTENPKQVDRRLTLCFSGLFQTVIAFWVLKWYIKNGMFLLFLNFWRMLGLWASVLQLFELKKIGLNVNCPFRFLLESCVPALPSLPLDLPTCVLNIAHILDLGTPAFCGLGSFTRRLYTYWKCSPWPAVTLCSARTVKALKGLLVNLFIGFEVCIWRYCTKGNSLEQLKLNSFFDSTIHCIFFLFILTTLSGLFVFGLCVFLMLIDTWRGIDM